MLVAIGEDGHQRYASAAQRNEHAYCPVCKEALILKAGRIVTRHFAHHPDSFCTYGQGESPAHMLMKESLHRWLTQWGADVELEVPVSDPERRADLVVTTAKANRFAIECQASPISVDEWDDRNSDYATHDMPVTWVWASTRINNRAGRDDEARFPAEMRHAIDLHQYDLLNIFDVIEPRLVQMFTHEANEREAHENEHGFKVNAYTPKSLRIIESTYETLPDPQIPALIPHRLTFRPTPLADGLTTIDLDWEQLDRVSDVAAEIIDVFGKAGRAA